MNVRREAVGPEGKQCPACKGAPKSGCGALGSSRKPAGLCMGGGQGHRLYGQSKHTPQGVLRWGSTSTRPALWTEVVTAQVKVG